MLLYIHVFHLRYYFKFKVVYFSVYTIFYIFTHILLCLSFQLLKPLQEKFQSVVCSQNFAQTYQTKQVQMEVLDLIECLTGVVDGCTLLNLHNLLPVINPLFEDIVKLVDLYHNYSTIVGPIFQVFCVSAKRILCYLNQVHKFILLQ